LHHFLSLFLSFILFPYTYIHGLRSISPVTSYPFNFDQLKKYNVIRYVGYLEVLYPNISSLTTEKITQTILNQQELVNRLLTNEEIKNKYLDLVQRNTVRPSWEILG
jgi:hypothetical protein